MAQLAGKRLVLIGILLLVLGSTAAAAYARQSGGLLPAISLFTSDRVQIDYAAVESGAAQVTLTWRTVNVNNQHRLALEARQGNGWVSVLGADEVLDMNGARVFTVTLPQNFGAPTYRLTLKTSRNEIIEQQYVTLPYGAASQAAPDIVAFTTAVQSVDTNLLVQNNSRIQISWQVVNRPAQSLIRFEQVFADGSTVNAELPRAVLWIPSSGEGVVAPRSTSARDNLVFRMSLVNLTDDSVYDTAEISIPVIGNVVQAGPQTQNNVTASNTTAVQGISAFSADTTTVAPGGSVTLNWDAGDAASVELLQNVQEGPTTLYIQLPPSGSLTVPVPEDAAGATYTLRAQSADGTVSTGEVSVSSESGEGQ